MPQHRLDAGDRRHGPNATPRVDDDDELHTPRQRASPRASDESIAEVKDDRCQHQQSPHSRHLPTTPSSAPKSTIASYIHRFRTQPPLDRSQRQQRLAEHHQQHHRDFWWLSKSSSHIHAESGHDSEMSCSQSRISVLPAIEKVLDDEGRRIEHQLGAIHHSVVHPHQSQSHLHPQSQLQAQSTAMISPVTQPLQSQPTVSSSALSPLARFASSQSESIIRLARELNLQGLQSLIQPALLLLQQQQQTTPTVTAPSPPPVPVPEMVVPPATHFQTFTSAQQSLPLSMPSLTQPQSIPLPSSSRQPQSLSHPLSSSPTASQPTSAASAFSSSAERFASLARSFEVRAQSLSAAAPPLPFALVPVGSALSLPSPSPLPTYHYPSVTSAPRCDDELDVDELLAQWRRVRNFEIYHTPSVPIASLVPSSLSLPQHLQPAHSSHRSEPTNQATRSDAQTSSSLLVEPHGHPNTVVQPLSIHVVDVSQLASHVVSEVREIQQQQPSSTIQRGNEVSHTPRNGTEARHSPSPSLSPSRPSIPLPPRSSSDRRSSLPSTHEPFTTAAAILSSPTLRPQPSRWIQTHASDNNSDTHAEATHSSSVKGDRSPPKERHERARSLTEPVFDAALHSAIAAVVTRALSCPKPEFARSTMAVATTTDRSADETPRSHLRHDEHDDSPHVLQCEQDATKEVKMYAGSIVTTSPARALAPPPVSDAAMVIEELHSPPSIASPTNAQIHEQQQEQPHAAVHSQSTSVQPMAQSIATRQLPAAAAQSIHAHQPQLAASSAMHCCCSCTHHGHTQHRSPSIQSAWPVSVVHAQPVAAIPISFTASAGQTLRLQSMLDQSVYRERDSSTDSIEPMPTKPTNRHESTEQPSRSALVPIAVDAGRQSQPAAVELHRTAPLPVSVSHLADELAALLLDFDVSDKILGRSTLFDPLRLSLIKQRAIRSSTLLPP